MQIFAQQAGRCTSYWRLVDHQRCDALGAPPCAAL